MSQNGFKISGVNEAILKKASHSHVESYFVDVNGSLRGEQWLWPQNRYRANCIPVYKGDLKTNQVNDGDLIRYIAASAPTHIVDAWSFVARAIEATLTGDSYAAIHFGYYAELRAAMGLLGSQGIGIFNQKHPTATSASQCEAVDGPGTHRLVWPCLDFWAQQRTAGDLVDSLIKPNGRSLMTWLNVCNVFTPIDAIAHGWLRTWGLDLAQTENDHANRNLASYRPSCFQEAPPLSAAEITHFVESLWELFEPHSLSTRFATIERYLLRQALRDAGAFPTQEHMTLLGMESGEAAEWLQFFSETTAPLPFDYAKGTSKVDQPHCHLEVLSRAALLLFIGTGAARRHMAAGGFDEKLLSFWWKPFGVRRGLWDMDSMPETALDFWADIRESIDEMKTWRENQASSDFSLFKLRKELAYSVQRLAGFDVGCVWGIVP